METTYNVARLYLAKGRRKTSRKLTGRSSEMRLLDNDDIAIRYHDTDVVTLHADDTATLNSDGFRTSTTKARINEYSPAHVSQSNGLWYMRDGSLFYDGVVINAEGNPLKPRQPAKDEKRKRKLDKLVSDYIKAFRQQIEKDRTLPIPGNGDCWYCSMVVSEPEKDRGKSLGEAFSDVSHILEHLREKYIFGSILWRAVQRRGNPSFCWQYGQSYAAKGDGSFLMDDLRYYLRTRKSAMLELMN